MMREPAEIADDMFEAWCGNLKLKQNFLLDCQRLVESEREICAQVAEHLNGWGSPPSPEPSGSHREGNSAAKMTAHPDLDLTTPEREARQMTHTPGPWHASRKSVFVSDINNNTICSMHARDEQAANARLLAAAPELLSALRFILAFYEPGQRMTDTAETRDKPGLWVTDAELKINVARSRTVTVVSDFPHLAIAMVGVD
jgi:hypothetical protein